VCVCVCVARERERGIARACADGGSMGAGAKGASAHQDGVSAAGADLPRPLQVLSLLALLVQKFKY
jgi:hypothetical protein